MKNKIIDISLVFLMIIGIGIASYYFGYLPKENLKKKFRFTVATIERFETQSEGSKEAIIYFYFKGKKIESSYSVLPDLKVFSVLGKRILIKFNPNDPETIEVLNKFEISNKYIDTLSIYKSLPQSIILK